MYVFHGTDRDNALSIIQTGFKKGTYFTPYLDSALVLGGEYVFAVWLEGEKIDDYGEDRWQFTIQEDWLPDRIESLVHYQCEMLLVRDKAKVKREDTCPTCKGSGELFDNDLERHSRMWLPKTHFIHRLSLMKFRVCPDCHGSGRIDEEKE